MSEDCHDSDNINISPEDFERWKADLQKDMIDAAKRLRSLSVGERDFRAGKTARKDKDGVWRKYGGKPPLHLGRWEELTLYDFKFLYECGVSCE